MFRYHKTLARCVVTSIRQKRQITVSDSSDAKSGLRWAEKGSVGIIGLPFNKGQVKAHAISYYKVVGQCHANVNRGESTCYPSL